MMARKLLSLPLILSTLLIAPFAAAQEPTPSLPPGVESFDELAAQFEYDADAPLDIQEVGTEMRGEVAVQDITFMGTDEDVPIEAYLIVPPGEGPFAAVLWVHWYEPGDPTSNRTEFLEEAVAMADQGVVSLLVSTRWSKRGFWRKDADYDLQVSIDQVIDLRRALDLLAARDDVDAQRIAVVGHDFGGMYAATLAGVDERVQAVVIMAGTPRFSEWFMLSAREEDRPKDYVDALARVDPITYVPYITPRAVFFQFADSDRFVSDEKADEFSGAARDPKQVGQYSAFHDLDVEEAQTERDAWLVEQLELDGE